MAKSAVEYKDFMDGPMEGLAIALWGTSDGPSDKEDYQIVEIAARKIELLKKMVIASGFSADMLKTILEDC